VEAEFRGEVGDRARTEDASIGSPPGAISLQILLAAAEDVVDATVQYKLCGAALDLTERHFI
jgi:hypothetical protein